MLKASVKTSNTIRRLDTYNDKIILFNRRSENLLRRKAIFSKNGKFKSNLKMKESV